MVAQNYAPLTDKDCRYLKPDQSRADGQCPGLVIIANKQGRKRWIHRSAEGQQTLGYYPRLSLTGACDTWRGIRNEQIKGEPEHAVAADIYCTRQLCRDYIDGYARKLKRSWREDERQPMA